MSTTVTALRFGVAHLGLPFYTTTHDLPRNICLHIIHAHTLYSISTFKMTYTVECNTFFVWHFIHVSLKTPLLSARKSTFHCFQIYSKEDNEAKVTFFGGDFLCIYNKLKKIGGNVFYHVVSNCKNENYFIVTQLNFDIRLTPTHPPPLHKLALTLTHLRNQC